MQRRIKAAFGGTAAIASLALGLTGCTAGGGGTEPTDGGGDASVVRTVRSGTNSPQLND